MKQVLFIALAIAIFSGCTRQNDEPQPPQKRGDGAIGFATSVLNKGASIGTTTITNFGVFGYGTGDKLWSEVADVITPTLFDNKEVVRSGSVPPYTWDYTGDDVTWDEGFLLNFTFFGYSPMATGDYSVDTPAGNGVVAPIAGQTNIPKVDFTALDHVQSQVDLLTAQVRDTKASVGPVLMKFNHALSRIGFKAFSTTAATAETKVDKIELTNVRYKGSLTLDGSWYSSADTKNFILTYTDTQAKIAPTAIDEDHPTDISDGDVNGYFMLLPQDLTTTALSKIIFHYSVGGTSVPPKEYVIKEDWGKGKSITYTVDLTANLEAPLNVTDVTITDWAMGTSESGDGDGVAKKVELTYNDGGTNIPGGPGMQNAEFLISKRPTNPIETWNTKPDGSGDYYGEGDMIIMKTNTTLYNVDNTVTIGGMRWLRGNLSGNAGSNTEYYAESSPARSGMFFKWGDTWVYQHESSTTDGLVGDKTFNASKEPKYSSSEGGYDYTGLNGGRASGDPCKKLGENFMTPTIIQYLTLEQTGRKTGTYREVEGYFLGVNANACTNNTIAPECIFVPFAGYRSSDGGELTDENAMGCYWVSTASTRESAGRYYRIHQNNTSTGLTNARALGYSVRCVSTDVNVKNVNWTSTNLRGTTDRPKEPRMVTNPQDFGNFFKWGDMLAYQRESSTMDDLKTPDNINDTWRAATSPAVALDGKVYDYGNNLSGGYASGDPCKALGLNYRTPTGSDCNQLWYANKNVSSYKGVNGAFFGEKAADCTDDKIAPNCIFLPFGGAREVFNGDLNITTEGFYWLSSVSSSTQPQTRAYAMRINLNGVIIGYNRSRGDGLSVRCVRDATIN